ncbi:MAG TPA: hypothetical protein VMJ33_07485 [Gallionella sp.]|nr:hypothetical protein [Gallionella sp.]
MKNILVAIMLVSGVALWGNALACDGKNKNKTMTSGTSVPASPTIASITPK